MKKKLQLKDIDPMIFAVTRYQNIKLIENNFSSKIVLRGNELYLDGKKNELIILESLVNDIIFTIAQKGFIDNIVQRKELKKTLTSLIKLLKKGKLKNES